MTLSEVCTFWLPSPNSPSPYPLPLVTTNLVSFLLVFWFVCFGSIIDWQQWFTIQWYLYILQTDHTSLITICYQTSYYSIINYIPMLYVISHLCDLFYNCKFVSFDPLHLFCPLILSGSHQFVFFISVSILFCFIDSTYKWNHTVFSFYVWLTSFT